MGIAVPSSDILPKFPQTSFEVGMLVAGSLDDRVVKDNRISTRSVFDEGEASCHS